MKGDGLRTVHGHIAHHKKNADGPYVKGGVTIGIFAVVSIVLFGASWFQSMLLSSNNFAAVVSAVLIDLANADRAALGIGTLAANEKLTAAAQAKADDMVRRGYFSHASPDGKEPWDFIREAGYDYKNAGENLAVQFSDSEKVERAWLASAKHRANILDGRFTEIGIATAHGSHEGKPTTFVVQMFGTPRAQVPPYMDTPAIPYMEAADATVSAPDPYESAVLGVVSALTNEAPATERAEENAARMVARVATSPETYFEYAITFLALITLMIGAYLWRVETRLRHYKHSAYAVLLSLALITFLYAVDAFIFTNPIVSASLITS